MTGSSDQVDVGRTPITQKESGDAAHETVEDYGASHGVDIKSHRTIGLASYDKIGKSFVTSALCFDHPFDGCGARKDRTPHHE